MFVIGAGFSAPAKIPIQNRILKEITKPSTDSILTFEPESESVKFMLSFIKVGLYLLQNYSRNDCADEISSFTDIEKKYINSDVNDPIPWTNQYREVQILKERVRLKLEKSDLQISLEDIFTSFDKSYQHKEYLYQHSYYHANEIKESIMRLFVYYFCKCTNNHTFDLPEYIDFCNYIQSLGNVTIISTNWDVLIEEYFNRQKIEYSLCLNEPYFTPSKTETDKSEPSKVNLIKLHGSINWFKCLNCGTLNIIDNKNCGIFLFEDSATECCNQCNQEVSDGLLLQSEIITPTMIKSINSQLYNNLWSTAKRDLREAVSVTFIGYSLPIADFELRYLLQRCIPHDIAIDVVLHSSDNPKNTELPYLQSLLPEKRYRDLFVKNDPTFFYNGFADYFKRKLK